MMLQFRDKNSRYRLTVLAVLVFVILWPMNSAFSSTRFLGLVLTPQRIMIPSLFLYTMATEREVWVIPKKMLDWRIFFFLWFSWSVILTLTEGYSNHAEAGKEMLGNSLSFMLVAVLYFKVKTIGIFCGILNFVKWFYIATILFGIFELLTGYHLSTSAHYQILGYSNNWYQPTGQFYGINDYSAYLAFFSPILIYRTERILSKFISIMLFISILYIMISNDAVIAVVGTMVGLISYLWIRGGDASFRRKLLVTILLVVLIATTLVFITPNFMVTGSLPNIFERLALEYLNYKKRVGSMFYRVSMYNDLGKLMSDQLFLGYGPASLLRVVEAKGLELSLLDPHNYHLELIFSYGLPLYLFLLIIYIKIVKANARLYRLTRHYGFAFIVSSITILPIVSIAPSSFIGYLYPWLIFALGKVSEDKFGKGTLCKGTSSFQKLRGG